MLEVIECAPDLLVTFGAECAVRCPAHGRRDQCQLQISYRTRLCSVEAGSLRDFLAALADRPFYAEELAEMLREAVAGAIAHPAMVTVIHGTEGVVLNVTAGRL
jgi:NADPH-dependent 7-cyano-7-deazaguanine reductase QueF